MKIWHKILKENKKVFIDDRDKIFFVIKIAFHCNDSSYREGYLALEEFVDGGCGMEKERIPLWEYLRFTVQILVDRMDLEEQESIKMMADVFLDSQYTGYESVQGCIYLISAFFILKRIRADRVLELFRSLIPKEMQESFDIYFQFTLEEWKANRFAWIKQYMTSYFSTLETELYTVSKLPTVQLFHETFEKMSDEKLKYVIQQIDIQTLEDVLIYTHTDIRERFFKVLLQKQQMLIMEYWYENKESYQNMNQNYTYYRLNILPKMEKMIEI